MIIDKIKLKFVLVGILVVGGFLYFFSSTPLKVGAERIVAFNGDIYRASDAFGSKKIIENKDVKILFEEKGDKILLGKGFEGGEPGTEGNYSTYLYVMDNNGLNEQRITDEFVDYAVFSKIDGNTIYYLTKNGKIYTYNILTKTNRLLTIEASFFDISSDGKLLVYEKAPTGWTPNQYFEGSPGFAVLDISTTKETLIPNTDESHGGGYAPLWIPNTNYILFFSDGIYMMDLNGVNRIQLTKMGDGTDTYGISDDPLWSSDGRYFIYHSDYEIKLIELDIKNKRVISAGAIAYGVEPRWVEEGKTISVLSPDAKAGAPSLSIVNLKGKVLSGDKTYESKYYSLLKGSLLRIKPKKVVTAKSAKIETSTEDLEFKDQYKKRYETPILDEEANISTQE